MTHSPLSPVQPDDPPRSWCPSCETKYDPYKESCECDGNRED